MRIVQCYFFKTIGIGVCVLGRLQFDATRKSLSDRGLDVKWKLCYTIWLLEQIIQTSVSDVLNSFDSVFGQSSDLITC